MQKEKQTVKKRIFISNTCMTLVTLLLFLLVNVGIVKIYEDIYRGEMTTSEIDENAYKAKEILTQWEASSLENDYMKLSDALKGINYNLCLENNEDIIYINFDEYEDEAIKYLKTFQQNDENIHIYLKDNMTIVTLYNKDKQLEVYAVKGKYNAISLMENSFTSFLILFLIDGLLCIAVLLVISQLFTRGLIKHIMKPLNALSEGAGRMRSGNLNQSISYKGDREFEEVCHTFDEMQEHLLKSKKTNESYERARTDMIAGISHDLRTPLTAIRGTIKGMQDGIANTPEKQKMFLDIAYRRTLDMDLLLQKLFFFSKLQTGNMPFTLIKTNIVRYIADYIKTIEYLTLDKGVNVIFKSECEEIFVNVDRDQMKRVFDNLIENSMKYAQVEQLSIQITVEKSHNKVLIIVSDNGKGESHEKLPHIFEQFYRGDESRNIKDGNGLGLYIVKYILETMDGTVWAENNNGLQISILLPEAKELNNEREK